MSAVKRVESVSDRMSYITLTGCWCHVIVLNVHAPIEDKIVNVKVSFYKELERVFNKVGNVPHPVAGCGGLYEMLRIPHCLDIGSQLTARYWPLVAVLTVQFVPDRKHTLSS
jgi:hypothetical protein